MRKKYFILAFAVLLAIAAATAFALDRTADATLRNARADVAVMPQSDVVSRPVAGSPTPRTAQDFRDSAALILVGSMLLGLAAAVRRTV